MVKPSFWTFQNQGKYFTLIYIFLLPLDILLAFIVKVGNTFQSYCYKWILFAVWTRLQNGGLIISCKKQNKRGHFQTWYTDNVPSFISYSIIYCIHLVEQKIFSFAVCIWSKRQISNQQQQNRGIFKCDNVFAFACFKWIIL